MKIAPGIEGQGQGSNFKSRSKVEMQLHHTATAPLRVESRDMEG